MTVFDCRPKFRRGQSVREKYTLGKVLGAGGRIASLMSRCVTHDMLLGFAVVKIATNRETGKKYACKIIRLPKNDNVAKDDVSRCVTIIPFVHS